MDSSGNVWVTDMSKSRIVEFSPIPEPSTLVLLGISAVSLLAPTLGGGGHGRHSEADLKNPEAREPPISDGFFVGSIAHIRQRRGQLSHLARKAGRPFDAVLGSGGQHG